VRSKFNFNVMYYVTSMSTSVNGTKSGDDMYLQWAMDSMNNLREDARNVAESIKVRIKDGEFDGRTERKIATLIEKLTNMDLLEDTNLKNAAFRLVVAPTPENADLLSEAATEVTSERIRAVLLD